MNLLKMLSARRTVAFTAIARAVLLATFLSVPLRAAQIKTRDGKLIEGTIQGTLVLRDLRHTETGNGAWGLLYYVIPGNSVTQIDENGIHWKDGTDIEMMIYILGVDPQEDLRGLSKDFATSWNFTLEHRGGNSSSTKGPPGVNPIPMPVYGEIRYEGDLVKELLPEVRVETPAGTAVVAVASLAAIVPKPASAAANEAKL